MPDKQQEVVKKFLSLGFVVIGKAKNGNIFVELRGNEPIRAAVAADGIRKEPPPVPGTPTRDLPRPGWPSLSLRGSDTEPEPTACRP